MAFKISVGLLAFTYSSVLALHPVGHSSLIRINNRKTTSSFQSWLRTKSSPAEDNKLPTLVESNDYEWISPIMFSAIAIMIFYPLQFIAMSSIQELQSIQSFNLKANAGD